MSKITDKTQALPTAALDFDKIEGTRESVTRRPMIEWKKLAGRDNSNKSFVVAGRLIEILKMNNPTGAKRETDFWLAAVVEITHPTKAVVNEEIVDVFPGLGGESEVLVPYGSEQVDLAKHLEPLLGHDVMFWVAIQPNGELDLKNGNNAMRLFKVKVGETGAYAPIKRTGRYLLGGPTARAPELVAAPAGTTQAQRANAAQTVANLQG